MNFLTLLLCSLFSFQAFSLEKKANYLEFHEKNSRVVEAINPKNALTALGLAKKITSPSDRSYFQKIFASKKGKNIKLYPLLDQVVIKENGISTSIRVVSFSPLVISVNGRKAVQIDPKNIYKSLNNKKVSFNFLNALLPQANAGLFSDDWAFLYSAAVTADPKFQVPGVSDEKYASEKLQEDMAKFLSDFDVSKFSCKNEYGPLNMTGFEFTNSVGDKFFINQKDGLVAPMLDGDYQKFEDKYVSLDKQVREGLATNARSHAAEADREKFDINDFEVNCTSGIVSNGCTLSPFEGAEKKYSAETLEKLKDADIYASSTSKLSPTFSGIVTEHAKMDLYIDQLAAHNPKSADKAYVVRAMGLCCKTNVCRNNVRQDTSLELDGTIDK